MAEPERITKYLNRPSDQKSRPISRFEREEGSSTQLSSNSRERQWVEEIRKGNEVAFELLFREYCDSLCDFVSYLVHSKEVAEEIVQDIFLDIWKRRCEWKPRVGIKAYLFGAARNKSLNYLKHVRIIKRWETQEINRETPQQVGPDDQLCFEQLQNLMEIAIEQLPERRRLVFRLARQYHMSFIEIAAALGISVKTVENQMGKALEVLRKRLSDLR